MGTGLGIYLAFMAFFAATNTLTLPLAALLALLMGLLMAGFYIIASNSMSEMLRPRCPSCGAVVLESLSRTANQLGMNLAQQAGIDCRYCGYSGPRLPIDGLWRYVDFAGPAPFQGTYLERVTAHSWWYRHPSKKRWHGIFGFERRNV